MIIVGDHTKHNKKYKYEFYQEEKPKQQTRSKLNSNRKLIRIDSKARINYDVWFKSLPEKRIEYLKRIGITDLKKLSILSRINYNLLPFDVRHALATKPN